MDNISRKAQPSTRLGRLFSNKDLLHLFFPLVIEQILVISVGMADSMMVASLGEAAVSGVSLIDHIGVLLNLVFVALATGGSVIIGQYLGRGDLAKAKEGGRQLIWLTGIISFVLMALFYASKKFIFANLFGSSSPEVIENASEYMLVLGTTIPFMALFQGGSAIFRTAGNTKLPMLTVVLMNILNIIGNALSVFILGWGVTGVALSTLNSRIVSVIIILYCARKYKFHLQLPPLLKVRLNLDLIKKMLQVGIPFSVENGLFQLGKIVVLSLVTTFGTGAIAANAVGNLIGGFEVIPGLAINAGMTTVIARCIGSGDLEQSKYYTKKIIGVVIGANIIVSGIIFALWPLLNRIYGLPETTMNLVWLITWTHAIFEIFTWPFSFTLPVTFRAAGDAKFAMCVGVFTMIVFRIGGAYVLCGPLGFGMFGAWLAMYLDWAVRAIIYIWRYLSGRYLRHKLI